MFSRDPHPSSQLELASTLTDSIMLHFPKGENFATNAVGKDLCLKVEDRRESIYSQRQQGTGASVYTTTWWCLCAFCFQRQSFYICDVNVNSFHQIASLEFQQSESASLLLKEEQLCEHLPMRLATYLDKNPNTPTGDISSRSKVIQYLETMRNILFLGIQQWEYDLTRKTTRIKCLG